MASVAYRFKIKNPNHPALLRLLEETGMADEPGTFEEVVAAEDGPKKKCPAWGKTKRGM